jgi:hypothetical protein
LNIASVIEYHFHGSGQFATVNSSPSPDEDIQSCRTGICPERGASYHSKLAKYRLNLGARLFYSLSLRKDLAFPHNYRTSGMTWRPDGQSFARDAKRLLSGSSKVLAQFVNQMHK